MDELRVFVGASSEADESDRLVREVLEEEKLRPVPWRKSFRPGEYGLDSIEWITRTCDGAVLLASPDDRTWYRGNESFSPRDNVIFEFGHFMHAFGRKGTVLVLVQDDDGRIPRVPTDVAGLNVIRFERGKPTANVARLRSWAQEFSAAHRPLHPEIRDTIRILGGLAELEASREELVRTLILQPFRYTLAHAMRGELTLTPGQYYNLLDAEISKAGKGTTILAVSTVSSHVWKVDRDQKDYFDRNLAAAARGARIRRFFILPEQLQSTLDDVIQEQHRAGISVRVARPEFASDISALDDVVLFIDEENSRMRGYVALPSFNNPERIRAGKLVVDVDQCLHHRESFEAAWAIAASPHAASSEPAANRSQRPPGESMIPEWLSSPVTSCEEAALARGVPLEHELKTLLLETPTGLIAAHLRGDSRLSLRAVKRAIETEQAWMASEQILRDLGLVPGTISAVLSPVWGLPHLIDRTTLSLPFVTTSNGTLTGYFRFDPKILLTVESFTVVDIAENPGDPEMSLQ